MEPVEPGRGHQVKQRASNSFPSFSTPFRRIANDSQGQVIHGPLWRWAMVFLTQLVFYGLPWLEWGQRQMVLFDLGARRFYIFGLVLYPQDFIYLTGLLIISALSLFLFTAVAGRLWCGFSCPQTVYTEIFMWIEHKIEGDRSARLRLDGGPWTFEKIRKKFFKQIVWITVALWTGFTFVGYFVPIRELGVELLAWQGGWQIFWVLFYGFATYGNAGFMREQVCKYMCPYARFQSAMFDKDTLIVSYDVERGEPRGPRNKTVDYKAKGLGDCIDCTLCVQVCPVGIDIRKGLQYECIGCGLCVDACNTVMDKMKYPRGLIRFTTQNGVVKRWTQSQMLRRVLRPRVIQRPLVALRPCLVAHCRSCQCSGGWRHYRLDCCAWTGSCHRLQLLPERLTHQPATEAL
jgi:cytochrome c oxidase accessory protein FixG